MAAIPGFTARTDTRHPDLPINYITNDRPEATSMVVLMPASLAQDRPDRTRIHYHRWKWQEAWPTSTVVCVPDPVLQLAPELNGAWFIHPKIDVVASIADIIAGEAAAADIPAEQIVFYGSSLGGFGAIACAAHLPDSRAVAEVPQIDFEHWHPKATRLVEDHVLKAPIASLHKTHPERLSLFDRIEYAGFVPPIHVVSNASDKTIDEQREFISWCHSSDLPGSGPQHLELTDLVEGHKALPREEAIARVRPLVPGRY